MAAMTGKFHTPGVSQSARDHHARQLRSDLLASLFKTVRDTIRERFTHAANDLRASG